MAQNQFEELGDTNNELEEADILGEDNNHGGDEDKEFEVTTVTSINTDVDIRGSSLRPIISMHELIGNDYFVVSDNDLDTENSICLAI